MAESSKTEIIHGAESFVLESEHVKVAVTAVGGHMGPVEFTLGERTVSPYALAPWLPDEVDAGLPVLLKNLRGDFFCFPFGPQENGQPHGDTANLGWTVMEKTSDTLRLQISPSDVGGSVEKCVRLKPGHTALYISHMIDGVEGGYNYGNHPVLDLSALEEAGHVSVSPFRWGSVYPGWFSDPADGARQALEKAARFTDLKEVPLAKGGATDLTRYPARPGNDDLVMMVNQPATMDRPFAWSAVVFDGYVWFALKDPADFPATLFWLSNGGRSAAPWSNRHSGRLGIEEVCSHFCDGVDVSRQDLLALEGIPTSRIFKKEEPVTLRFIQAVAEVPVNFGRVSDIFPAGEGEVVLLGEGGTRINARIDWRFLITEK